MSEIQASTRTANRIRNKLLFEEEVALGITKDHSKTLIRIHSPTEYCPKSTVDIVSVWGVGVSRYEERKLSINSRGRSRTSSSGSYYAFMEIDNYVPNRKVVSHRKIRTEQKEKGNDLTLEKRPASLTRMKKKLSAEDKKVKSIKKGLIHVRGIGRSLKKLRSKNLGSPQNQSQTSPVIWSMRNNSGQSMAIIPRHIKASSYPFINNSSSKPEHPLNSKRVLTNKVLKELCSSLEDLAESMNLNSARSESPLVKLHPCPNYLSPDQSILENDEKRTMASEHSDSEYSRVDSDGISRSKMNRKFSSKSSILKLHKCMSEE